jgi:hypothetical protein
MKITFLAGLVVCALCSSYVPASPSQILWHKTDSSVVRHVLDGSVVEWPTFKFEEDKETTIKYAIDNDAQNLYVAMIIPSFSTQRKMMSMGMKLYVDLKGKRKQTRGIEFPVLREAGESGYSQSSQSQAGDMEALRSRFALNLLTLKLFGFNGFEESKAQGLLVPGSVNIQFNWSEDNVMFVEYSMPLNILDDNASLDQKNISLGWQLNGNEQMSSGNQPSSPAKYQTRTTRTVVSTPAGTSPGTNNTSVDQYRPANKEQSFWTKYTIIIPSH